MNNGKHPPLRSEGTEEVRDLDARLGHRVEDKAVDRRSFAIRLVASGLVWALCYPAIFFYLAAVGGITMVAVGMEPFPKAASTPVGLSYIEYSLPFGVIAWILFGAMNLAWVFKRRMGKAVPVVGTISAIIGACPFGLAGILALPGALFAAYLCVWHWRVASNDA